MKGPAPSSVCTRSAAAGATTHTRTHKIPYAQNEQRRWRPCRAQPQNHSQPGRTTTAQTNRAMQCITGQGLDERGQVRRRLRELDDVGQGGGWRNQTGTTTQHTSPASHPHVMALEALATSGRYTS